MESITLPFYSLVLIVVIILFAGIVFGALSSLVGVYLGRYCKVNDRIIRSILSERERAKG